MPEREPDPGGIISRAELTTLAGWFDAFEHALDPLSKGAREAERKFEDQVNFLYEGKVSRQFPSLTRRDFREGLRTLCRRFLQRENPGRRSL